MICTDMIRLGMIRCDGRRLVGSSATRQSSQVYNTEFFIHYGYGYIVSVTSEAAWRETCREPLKYGYTAGASRLSGLAYVELPSFRSRKSTRHMYVYGVAYTWRGKWNTLAELDIHMKWDTYTEWETYRVVQSRKHTEWEILNGTHVFCYIYILIYT